MQALLVNNVELSMAISKHVRILEEITDEEKHDPPKVLSDVLESVLGVLFVDCDYNYDKVAVIMEMVLDDLLRPDLPKDPVTELVVWVAQCGCRCQNFMKGQSRQEVRRHDIHVVGPAAAPNLSMAKALAAERASELLSDPAACITPLPVSRMHVYEEGRCCEAAAVAVAFG